MRVLIINSVCGVGSTGRICTDLAQKYEKEGHEVKIAYGRYSIVPDEYRKFAVRIGNGFSVKLHWALTRVLDLHGLGSYLSTIKFLSWAESYDPNILWLHNIHGYYINYDLLFNWIKSRPDMEVKWTLHDCWAFTGHCTHFTYVQCNKWQIKCEYCPQKKNYPASLFLDNSTSNYQKKRTAFTGVKNMTLITPSKWLASLVKKSFLSNYPVEVVYNTVDNQIFRPTECNFKEKYMIMNKKIVLGVSNAWQDPRKGLKDLIKLSRLLSDDYVIVIVGLSDKEIKQLPTDIIGIKKTDSARELAGIYTVADVLVNPTYEDNYPTVNIEAEACGTRVITYSSGGAPETIHMTSSVAVNPGDIEKVAKIIMKI